MMLFFEVLLFGGESNDAQRKRPEEVLKLRFELSIAEAKQVTPAKIRLLLADIIDRLLVADLQGNEDDAGYTQMKVPLEGILEAVGEVEAYAKKDLLIKSNDIVHEQDFYRIVFGEGEVVFKNH